MKLSNKLVKFDLDIILFINLVAIKLLSLILMIGSHLIAKELYFFIVENIMRH